jgi:hypothetical protein
VRFEGGGGLCEPPKESLSFERSTHRRSRRWSVRGQFTTIEFAAFRGVVLHVGVALLALEASLKLVGLPLRSFVRVSEAYDALAALATVVCFWVLPSAYLGVRAAFHIETIAGTAAPAWVLSRAIADRTPDGESAHQPHETADHRLGATPFEIAPVAVARWQLGVMALIAVRLLSLSPRCCRIIEAVADAKNELCLFCVVFALVIYVYACVGVSLLSGRLAPINGGDDNYIYDGGSNDGDGDDDFAGNDTPDVLTGRVALNSYADAFLALFQIAVTNNWQDIMNANAFSRSFDASPAVRWISAGYFCSFFMIIVWFGTNVMTALILDVYERAHSRERQEEALAANATDGGTSCDGKPDGGGFGDLETGSSRGGRSDDDASSMMPHAFSFKAKVGVALSTRWLHIY